MTSMRAMERNFGVAVVALVLRVILGVWFAISGIIKVFFTGLDQFTRDVANYRMVVAPLDAVVAYTLPWLEIVAGILLMLGLLRRGAILAISGLVAMFVVAIGWAWSQGLDISCGCQGGAEAMNYWGKALELTGYAVVLGWLWWVETRGGGSTDGAPVGSLT
jgi:uncharacterized membrane protein YphA (DoxX/SURF4 family)